MRLQGKTALVTAAGQGIGYASALALAAGGAHVWATDIDASLLERYDGVANISVGRLDVLDRAAIEALFATLPRLDVLFNCAGIVHHGSALDASDDDLEFAFALNVRFQLWTIQAALPGMLAAGGGSIINMASVASSIKGLPNRCVYGLTKAAVIGLTLRASPPTTCARESAATRSARGRSTRRRSPAGSTPTPIPSRRARPSSIVSRWAGSLLPKRSRRSSSILRATNRSLRPGRRSASTAA